MRTNRKKHNLFSFIKRKRVQIAKKMIFFSLNYLNIFEMRSKWDKTYFILISKSDIIFCMQSVYYIWLLIKVDGSTCQEIKVLPKLVCYNRNWCRILFFWHKRNDIYISFRRNHLQLFLISWLLTVYLSLFYVLQMP